MFREEKCGVTWSDGKLSDTGMSLITGVGMAIIAPVLLPVLGAILRPVLKEAIKAGFLVVEMLQEAAAEGEEHFSDLLAEAKAEYAAGKNGQAK